MVLLLSSAPASAWVQEARCTFIKGLSLLWLLQNLTADENGIGKTIILIHATRRMIGSLVCRRDARCSKVARELGVPQDAGDA